MMTVHKSLQCRAYEKLLESRIYQTFRTAFQKGTGLPMHLIPADEDDDFPEDAPANPFCDLAQRRLDLEACRCSHEKLAQGAAAGGRTQTCFAGFKETAVPVRSGQLVVGYLRTGRVFAEGERPEEFAQVARELGADLTPQERVELEEAHRKAPEVPLERYLGCVTILTVFAAQLSEELNRILIAEEHAEPPMVTAAKQYVNAHIEEKIVLDEVAKYVHVSPYYFCKMFKQSTGMTLTEFVNRRRVERAKRRLLNPQTRVTEVAYDVGYQSLSQFNRSFLKYAGKSPTQFRAEAQADEEPFAA